MYWTMLCTAVLLGMSATAALAQAPVSFTNDHFLLIKGEPRLLLGLYEYPADDAVLSDAAAAGFNLICAAPDKAKLDRLQAHGVYAWIPLGGALDIPEEEKAAEDAKAKLASTINQFKDHPALLAWEAPDESLWNNWYGPEGWVGKPHIEKLKKPLADLKTQDAEKGARLGALLDHATELADRGLIAESLEASSSVARELNLTIGAPTPFESTQKMGEALTRGWEHVATLDKAHPFWQNHAPRNAVAHLQLYNKAVHAAGCDIYPVPANYGVGHSDLTDKTLASVGAYTDRMQAGAPGKACWMVLQGFGWRDIQEGAKSSDPEKGRRPNWQESRFMAYNTLMHGAAAVLYWGTAYIEKDSELWRDLLKLARELRALEPAFVAPDVAPNPQAVAELNYASFDGSQPLLKLRKAGDDWALIAVNECGAGVAFQVRGLPAALEGKELYRLNSSESVHVKNGGFRDGIRGYDVHVYATTRSLEPKQ